MRQEPPLGVLVAVEHGDRHVLLAHPAIDDGDLPVLDAVARAHRVPFDRQQPAQGMIVGIVGETQPRLVRVGRVARGLSQAMHDQRVELVLEPGLGGRVVGL